MAINEHEKVKKEVDKSNLFDKKTELNTSFESGLADLNSQNIKLAQALNQDQIEGIESDANLDLIPPDDIQTNTGAPSEDLQIEQGISSENTPNNQIISPDLFEGDGNQGLPEEITSEEAEVTTAPDLLNVGPEETLENGNPAQSDLDEVVNTNQTQENEEFIPEEANDTLGRPEESELTADIEEQTPEPEQAEIQQQTISPEEEILINQPAEGIAENIIPDENIENIETAPTVSELEGEPSEAIVENNIPENQIEDETVQDLGPILAESEGNPIQETSQDTDIDIAQSTVSPEESVTDGNPAQSDDINNISDQDTQDIQIAQISPEQEEQDGLPEQGLAETQEESSIDVALVSPEESAEQGFPLQEDSITEAEFDVAGLDSLAPQEGGIEEYVNEVFEQKLSDGIEKGLSPQEAAIAAIEAGRNAVKETASNPEEMNELAENLSDNLINQINEKIEKIENDLIAIKETPTEVAQATTEESEEAQEETLETPTEVAQATTETKEEAQAKT